MDNVYFLQFNFQSSTFYLMCPPAALRTASKRASALLQVARMYSGSIFFHARFSCFFRFSKFLRQIAAAFIYNHINGWSNSCQRILWVFVSRLLCENGWRYIEYKSMFLYNFLWPKKKEKTDFFLTPAVWPQIAAQSVSLLIDTLYTCPPKEFSEVDNPWFQTICLT